MKKIVSQTHDESSFLAAEMIIELVNQKKDASIAIPTGSTPEKTYEYLVKAYEDGRVDFSNVRVTNIDEYVGLGPEHEQGFVRFVDDKFYSKTNVKEENIYKMRGDKDPELECKRLHDYIENNPFDLALVGIGNNGHIAFNEPWEGFCMSAHTQDLDQETIEANARFFASPDEVPKKAITMGMGELMSAKRVILLASGPKKKAAITELFEADAILPSNPSTLLKVHSDANIFVDKEAYPG